MKKLIYLGLIISLIACQPKKTVDYAVVSGEIENPTFKTFKLWHLENNFSEPVSLLEDNTFIDTIKSSNASFYSLGFEKNSYNIYLEPSFNLKIKYDASKKDSAISFTGVGATENTFLRRLAKFNQQFKKYKDYHYLGALNESDLLTKMDSVKKAKTDFLNNSKGISENFKKFEQKNILYSWANQLNYYESYRRYVTKDKKFKVSESFYNYKKELSVEDNDLISIPSYAAYFRSYVADLTEIALKKDSLQDWSQVYIKLIADSIKSQTLKNNLLYNDAKFAITYADDFEAYYKTFIDASTNKNNNAKITKIYQALKKVAKGNPSPQFVAYENYKGGTTSLKDLKGKFVYVDVWATWCGPCKKEIPFLKKIEKAYHGKNIAFVSISVDTKKAHSAWQKMIKEKNMGGIQLFADNNWKSKFVTDYMIKGIPRFILIDPKGNIVSANAPRPSNPKLKTLLKEYNL
ncbi:MAG: TlpA disulfide reductase family protein [Flavobacteriaceae bacterium]